MDMTRFRALLRTVRKEQRLSAARLSALTQTAVEPVPIGRSAIYDIEKGITKEPAVQTVARLVEAIPGLTLSAFFARLETDGTVPAQAVPDDGLPPLPDDAELVRHAIQTLAQVAARQQERAIAASDRQTAGAASPPTERPRHRRGRPRRTARPKAQR